MLTNYHVFSRMPTEGNQREFLFYMFFHNKRSKPIGTDNIHSFETNYSNWS